LTSIIQLTNLTKRYGTQLAVNGINLEIQAGEIFGFIGPNGAGKTSTIRILSTLLAPTSGEAYVGGFSVQREAHHVRGLIGYMPDFFGIYNDLSVGEYLDFFAGCYDISTEHSNRVIPELLDLVELSHRRDDPVNQLSRGMQQRLSLARALINDPQVLFLDEPASGLDPRARVEIRELLKELAHMGKTIFFSSHILSDVADICSRIGIVEAGELVACGTPQELHNLLVQARKIRVSFLDNPPHMIDLLSNLPGVDNVYTHSQDQPPYIFELEFRGELSEMSQLLKQLVDAGLPVVHFSESASSLEEVFLRATRGIVN
jgi:ABC-2 type transport system ATP-binding protein